MPFLRRHGRHSSLTSRLGEPELSCQFNNYFLDKKLLCSVSRSRMPGLALATIDASVALRTSSGSRRRSSPFSSIKSKAYRNMLSCKEAVEFEFETCMSSEHFGHLAWQFKRMSGSSGLKVQAAIAC